MTKPSPFRMPLYLVLAPAYALYGLWVLVRSVLGGGRLLQGKARALDDAVFCQNGHRNETIGRWACAGCKAEYHGWVGACELCRAGAGWIRCSTCHIGIRLPWR